MERQEESEHDMQENEVDMNDIVAVVEAHPSNFYGVAKRGGADDSVIGGEGDEVVSADSVEGDGK